MENDKQLLLPESFFVVDAAFDAFVRSDNKRMMVRKNLTSGSAQYVPPYAHLDRNPIYVVIRAMNTYSTLVRGDRDIVRTFEAWWKSERQLLEEMAASDRSRKPGPKVSKVNEDARQAYAAGKTIDELLPEYAKRRRMDPVKARELLRKTVKGVKQEARGSD